MNDSSKFINRRVYRYRPQQVCGLKSQLLRNQVAKEEIERRFDALLREKNKILFDLHATLAVRDRERAESNMKIRKLTVEVQTLRHLVGLQVESANIAQLTDGSLLFLLFVVSFMPR